MSGRQTVRVTTDLVLVVCGLVAVWWAWWVPGEMARIRDQAALKGADPVRFDKKMAPVLQVVRPLVAIAGIAIIVVGVIGSLS